MLLNVHADDRSLDPGALDQRLYRRLPTPELAFVTVLGKQPEAREVAEPVVDERHDLAGELDDFLPTRALSRQISIGNFWLPIAPSVAAILEQKQ